MGQTVGYGWSFLGLWNPLHPAAEGPDGLWAGGSRAMRRALKISFVSSCPPSFLYILRLKSTSHRRTPPCSPSLGMQILVVSQLGLPMLCSSPWVPGHPMKLGIRSMARYCPLGIWNAGELVINLGSRCNRKIRTQKPYPQIQTLGLLLGLFISLLSGRVSK